MTTRMDGKKTAEKIRERTKAKVARLKGVGLVPLLMILRVGEDPASISYEKAARREMERTGIQAEIVSFPASVSLQRLQETINAWNQNEKVHGILVMQPFPAGISAFDVSKEIDPEKDIDGFSLYNLGALLHPSAKAAGFAPSTPQAVMRMLKEYKIPLKGKDVTIVGSSPVVGEPLALMMLNEGATVTVCHIHTTDLKKHTQQADILISATGAVGLITKDHIKQDAVVIDVGYGQDANGNVSGDVQYEEVLSKSSYLTPVPGGVGALTSAILAEHVVLSAERTVEEKKEDQRQKKEWRKKGQELLVEHSKNPQEKEKIEEALRKHLFSSKIWKESRSIGVTLSSSIEWDTKEIILQAWREGKTVAVPKTVPSSKQMDFYVVTNFEQVRRGHFGMEEPVPEKTQKIEKQQIDLMIVPGLIYNESGYRIGFGGGYYDRFLSDFSHATLALLHSDQLVSSFPVEKFDIPVAFLVTEEGMISSKKERTI